MCVTVKGISTRNRRIGQGISLCIGWSCSSGIVRSLLYTMGTFPISVIFVAAEIPHFLIVFGLEYGEKSVVNNTMSIASTLQRRHRCESHRLPFRLTCACSDETRLCLSDEAIVLIVVSSKRRFHAGLSHTPQSYKYPDMHPHRPPSCKPPIHTQPYKHSTRRGNGRPSAAHPKHALALANHSFLCFQLRVARHVCEGAEADKGCATCI